jgi:hypothetical protein
MDVDDSFGINYPNFDIGIPEVLSDLLNGREECSSKQEISHGFNEAALDLPAPETLCIEPLVVVSKG